MPVSRSPENICLHCGTPFRPTAERPDFCCAGCQFVRDLIQQNNFDQFYDLQAGQGQPVQSLVFQKRDFNWLEDLGKIAEASGPQVSLTLDLQGISCVGCVWLIEKIFLKEPGALKIHIDSNRGQLELLWEKGPFNLVSFARRLQNFGYLLGPPGTDAPPESSRLLKRLGLCGAFALNTMLFAMPTYLGMEPSFAYAGMFEDLQLLFATLSVLVGGTYFFGRTWHSLRNGILHIDLPISLGILCAYAASIYALRHSSGNFIYFDFVSIFTFLMLVGRWLQQKAVERNRHLLLSSQSGIPEIRLLEALPQKPSPEEIPSLPRTTAQSLKIGSIYALLPGQTIPVRSTLLSDGATLGLEWINGEAEAKTVGPAYLVPSGACTLGQSPILLEARESWDQSILSALLEITPREPFKNRFLEAFLKNYILVVLILAMGGGLFWLNKTGNWLQALQVTTSILVVSCPCASGVAIPLAEDLAISTLRRSGLFVRDPSLWIRLRKVRHILFDKTGTLTLETLSLKNPESLSSLSLPEKEFLLTLIESSLHPVSICLRENLLSSGVRLPLRSAPPEIREEIGFGLEMSLGDAQWRLGRPSWALTESEEAPSAEAVFSKNGQVISSFHFGEAIRPDAIDEIKALQREGFTVHILSGDRRHKVEKMAATLGLPISQCGAEMSPSEKESRVRELPAESTLMIGDGANDSLAFNASHCTGTPAVDRGLLEHKADFYFLGQGLGGVRDLIATSHQRQSTIRKVVAFAITYNTGAIILCLCGLMSPLLAAILMPSSSLVSLGIVMASFQKMKT